MEEVVPIDSGPGFYRLIIPEHLENSQLHWQLKRLARKDRAQVLVDRTGSSRSFRVRSS